MHLKPFNSRDENNSKKWLKTGIMVGLVYANFWTAASVSVQAPFFPREAELKGATATQYGLVFGIYELAIFIMSPIYGKMISRASPKLLTTFGLLVAGISCILFGILDFVLVGPLYIALAFIVRIIEGVGAAAFLTASSAILAMEFPDAIATTYSLTTTSFGIGLTLGPTIGGALYQVGGYMLPFIISGVFLVLGCALLAYFLPKNDGEKLDTSSNFLGFLYDCGIICYALSGISCHVFLGFNTATLEPFLRKFNLTPMILGLAFVMPTGIYALTTPIWGVICDKGANPLHITILGYFLTCLGMLFIAPVPFIYFQASLWTVILSLLSIHVGVAAKLVASFTGALQNSTYRGFPVNLATYGIVSAFHNTVFSIGGCFGPSLGGILLDTTGYAMGTVVMLSLELVCMLVLVLYLIFGQHSTSPKEGKTDANICPVPDLQLS